MCVQTCITCGFTGNKIIIQKTYFAKKLFENNLYLMSRSILGTKIQSTGMA